MTAQKVMRKLDKYENPTDVAILQRFFKTGEGQYGSGDVFVGIKMPLIRKIARQYSDLSLSEVEKLLDSPVHEHRMTALVIMTERSKKADNSQNKDIYDLYLRRTDRINNWDLVDVSCRGIVGGYLLDKPRDDLYKLSSSDNLWERRIAIVSTGQFIDSLAISELLINDEQDLIQKAVGWMLREAGKKNEQSLKRFLDKHYKIMPRTMLRYSLEKLSSIDWVHYMGWPI